MDMDKAAIMDSEIMRNYLKNELKKEAESKPSVPEVNEEEVVQAFTNFESEIKDNPKTLAVFKALQTKFGSDKEYAKSCDPLFVQAVMMLDLDQ